jgi:vacuolar-type H+-ATPase subunit D/Vma8
MAAKRNVIPKYATTIHFIKSSLEEGDRNTFFQINVLREQRDQRSVTSI